MRLLLVLLIYLGLSGCTTACPKESAKIEEALSPAVIIEDGEVSEETMVNFEKVQQLFLMFQDSMEIVLEEFERNFEYINIDADSQGKLRCTFAQKGALNNTLELDSEGLSKYTDQYEEIAFLFDALNLSRMSYTSETTNNVAIINFVLSSQTETIQDSDHLQQNTYGIAHSIEPFGEYSYLDGDWFYYQSEI